MPVPKIKDANQFVASLSLAIALFALMAILIMLGTCIPQEPLVGSSFLIAKYGMPIYLKLASSGLNDVFHSWWFVFVLVLLAVNLTLVSFRRVFPRAKKAILWAKPLTHVPQAAHYKISGNLAQFVSKLKAHGWEMGKDSKTHSLVARKGAFHRLAPSITHVGILTILLGAMISAFFGFNGVIQGISGDQFVLSDIVDGSDTESAPRSNVLVQSSYLFHSPIWFSQNPDVEVEIMSTSREDYADQTPKQWSTELEFRHVGGSSLQKHLMSVNQPVKYEGIDFYQADWNRVMRLKFNGKSYEIKTRPLPDKKGELAYLEITPQFQVAFWKPQSLDQVNILRVKEDEIERSNLKPIALLKRGETASLGGGNMSFEYEGVFSKTGIQYKYSPGDGLMILGLGIMMLGVIIAFGAKQTIWAIEGEEKIIHITYNADRDKSLCEKDFKQFLVDHQLLV